MGLPPPPRLLPQEEEEDEEEGEEGRGGGVGHQSPAASQLRSSIHERVFNDSFTFFDLVSQNHESHEVT